MNPSQAINNQAPTYTAHTPTVVITGTDQVTTSQKVLDTIKKIACFVISILSDLVMTLFAAGLAIFAACYKSNFDPAPDQVKKDKPPILMIHGSGFNEMQWVIGRQFLSGDKYGSVFTLNLDGLVSNQQEKGIDDYANDKVVKKIEEIKKLTGRDDVILIGHSMGGLISAFYAEYLSGFYKTNVKQVVTISSPWQAPPLLQFATKITESLMPNLFKNQKRYRQMLNEYKILDHLKGQAQKSEMQGQRKYYSIYSTADMMVPGKIGNLSTKPSRSVEYSALGHFTPMVYPPVWRQIQNWLAEQQA